MKNNKLFLLSLLGLLTGLAPVINNMFAPAMPSMATALAVDKTSIEFGLTASLIGLALGQIVLGPMSDRYGRRRVLLASLLSFVVFSVLLIWCPSPRGLALLRLLQGVAAGGGIVISRSIAADVARDRKLMQMLAVINVINGILPIVTPMLGSSLVSTWAWQGVFVAMAAIGVILLLGCFAFDESLPREMRKPRGWRMTVSNFGKVLGNGRFMATVIHQGGALGVLFANIAVTPFLVRYYGLDDSYTGWLLALNGICTAVGAGLAAALQSARHGVGVTGAGLAVMSIPVLWVLVGHHSLWVYEAVICTMLVLVGITLTSSSSLAMDLAHEQAGTASAVLGAVGFIAGAIVAPLVSLGDMIGPTSITLLVSCLIAAIAGLRALARSKPN